MMLRWTGRAARLRPALARHAHGCTFSAAERTAFERDGFVILRGVIPPAECERFLWAAVEPALARAGIKHDDRTTWKPEDGTTVQARHPTAPSARRLPASRPDSGISRRRLRRRLTEATTRSHCLIPTHAGPRSSARRG